MLLFISKNDPVKSYGFISGLARIRRIPFIIERLNNGYEVLVIVTCLIISITIHAFDFVHSWWESETHA